MEFSLIYFSCSGDVKPSEDLFLSSFTKHNDRHLHHDHLTAPLSSAEKCFDLHGLCFFNGCKIARRRRVTIGWINEGSTALNCVRHTSWVCVYLTAASETLDVK